MASKVWTQSGRETLLASSDLINPSLSLIDELFENITNQIANTGLTRAEWRFNNLATNIYATRFNQNGAGDATGTSQSAGVLGNTAANAEDNFNWFYLNNVTSLEKMLLNRTMDAGGATASTAPQRIKGWIKAASTVALSSIQVTNLFGAGDFGIGSQMQVATAVPEVGVGQLGSWVELGRATAIGGETSLDVSSLPNKRYYLLVNYLPTQTATMNRSIRLNSDAGTNYSRRESNNGGAEALITSTTILYPYGFGTDQDPSFNVTLIANLTTREKLSINHMVSTSGAGAGQAPDRREQVAKWTNTVASIDEVNIFRSGGTGTFPAGAESIVLGWTPADATTTESNFWQPIGETILTGSADVISTIIAPKKYLWIQIFQNKTGNARGLMTFNSDSGTNYARRSAQNGAADILSTSATSINVSVNLAGNEFTNMFVINEIAREKLMSGHTIGAPPSGAGVVPNRLELVGKWANTVSPITQLQINNDQAGDYIAGSFLRVWGHD